MKWEIKEGRHVGMRNKNEEIKQGYRGNKKRNFY